jgi:hypothetical protein
MKVSIKGFDVTMDPGNTGITFDVYDNDDKFLGDLRLGRGAVEWCKGKTRAGNGIQVKWPELLAFFLEAEIKQQEKASRKKTKAPKKPKGTSSSFKVT